MKNMGQFYRLGVWKVNTGDISDFIKAWKASADWIYDHMQNNGEAVLLQDMEDPNRFISFAFSDNPEKADEVMSRPEFQEIWSGVIALCEDVQPNRMQVAAFSGP